MLDPTAPTPAAHPDADRRSDVLTVVFGVWMLIGLFLDGWAHNEKLPDGFFTPWHAVLYTGFAGAAGVTLRSAVHRSTRSAWRDRLAGVDRVALAGLGLFALGGAGDLLWHEMFGVETNLDALLSPTHLLLMTGGVLTLSGPFRRAWRAPRPPNSLRSFLPGLISLSLTVGVLIFFTAYASPFGRTTVATFDSVTTHLHEFSRPSNAAFEQVREMWALTTILFTTFVVVLPALALIRWWSPPRGSMMVVFVAIGIFQVGTGEFFRSPLALAVFAAGAVAEVAVAHRAPAWVFGAVIPAVLWSSYMLLVAVVYDLRWSPELWAGSIVLSCAFGAIIGLVAIPRWTKSQPQDHPVMGAEEQSTPADA